MGRKARIVNGVLSTSSAVLEVAPTDCQVAPERERRGSKSCPNRVQLQQQVAKADSLATLSDPGGGEAEFSRRDKDTQQREGGRWAGQTSWHRWLGRSAGFRALSSRGRSAGCSTRRYTRENDSVPFHYTAYLPSAITPPTTLPDVYSGLRRLHWPTRYTVLLSLLHSGIWWLERVVFASCSVSV